MIISEKANIRICNSNRTYYRNKGYNVNNCEYIDVYVKDLPKGSNVKILVQCDYCFAEYTVIYNDFNKNNRIIDKTCCKDCIYHKTKEILLKKYGVSNAYYLEEAINKKKQTNLERYGCEYAIASDIVREKIKNTVRDKYQCDYIVQSDFIKSKIKSINLHKYGTEYPFQNKEYLNKINNITLEKYGTRLFAKSISKQQRCLCEILNMKINYSIGKYFADCFDESNSIVLEYDGKGHSLSVRLNKISQEEFDKKEILRERYIIDKGLKIIRFISYTDILPSDIEILSIYKEIVFTLTSNNYTICRYNLDNKQIHYE